MRTSPPHLFCVTVKVCLAMVRAPPRSLPVVLASTAKVTLPLPVPLEPLVTVIQFALLTAVQVQPGCVVTEIGPPVPIDFSKLWLVGEMAYVHGPGN